LAGEKYDFSREGFPVFGIRPIEGATLSASFAIASLSAPQPDKAFVANPDRAAFGGRQAGMGTPSARFADLAGAGVLITGGASGIGAALAAGFAAQGSRVAIIDRDRDAAERTVATIKADTGLSIHFEHIDLTDIAAAQAAVQRAASALGGLKVVVNNAAWDDRHAIDTVTVPYWDNNIAINLRPAFFVSQAAVPFLKAGGGGAIVNFSSIAYLLNLPNMAAYLAAKAGIIGLTKGLAGELGSDNIRVNAILPGMVLTERQKALWVSDADAAAHTARQALKFSLTAEDMIGPCLFLASDCSAAMTAQSLIVDGGFL
jgi:NAD(P)-dependent dehydrogenase (short-subunit alcohol dehydrogenase family)